MPKIIDGFLFHDEIELLEVRLQYLADTVDRFVIVTSSETFTGHPKSAVHPKTNAIVARFLDRIQWVHLDSLIGRGPWERESYSRNAIASGLVDCQDDDLIVISDIDELPRKSTLQAIRNGDLGAGPLVLGLDYFNFKFNYQLVHGVQTVWAGPIVCRYGDLTSPQQLRDLRWAIMEIPRQFAENAGWHFSYLTSTGDLAGKLSSFSHQDPQVQQRGHDAVAALIDRREGFHDMMHAGSIWAVVDFETFGCPELVALIQHYPQLLLAQSADLKEQVRKRIRHSARRIYDQERTKVLAYCSGREIANEVLRRLKRKFA